jgi:flagellar hook-associated protein 2
MATTSTPTVSFSGLASGLNTSSLISQLVAAAKQPERQLLSEQSDLASKTSIVGGISSNLGALGDLVNGMSLDTDVQFRTVSTSDSHVSVAVSGTAGVQTHDIRVQQLASAQVTTSNAFASDAAGAAGSGSVTIQIGSGSAKTVSWTANDSLESIAQSITNANAGVSASVLFDGSSYRIVTSATKTGTANAPVFTDAGSPGLGLSAAANVKVAAKDAIVSVDGIAVTRPTNVLDDVLPGMTITATSAQAAGDPDTVVGVSVDHAAIANKLQTFVSAYNTVVSELHGQLDYTGSTAGTNTLFGDSTLESLEGAMSNIATGYFGSGTLADLGMTIDKTGRMSLDQTKLDAAIAADPNALSTLFVRGGLSHALTQLTNGYTEAGDGILTQQASGFTDQSKQLQTQITQIDDNASALQTQLQTQFNALETTMSQLNSQSSYISKILA